jgi:plastocyanin
MAHRLFRRLAMAGGILSLLALTLPTAASAQIIQVDPTSGRNPESINATPQKAAAPINGVTLGVGGLDPSRHIVVNISDTGFDKQDYTVLSSIGMSLKSDIGTIEFKNTGTMVHTATTIPGSGYLRVTQDNYQRCGGRTCNSDGPLDTGGIAPGQSVVVGLQYAGGGQVQSATDCPPFGNSTPGFKCDPVNLTIKGTGLSNILNSSMEGTVHHNADGTLSTVRTFNSVKGSPKAPLSGQVTVTIDDENGYDPTTLYVLAGTIVTFVNNGQMVHHVRGRSPSPPTIDWVTLADSGGLGPGESWSTLFDCLIPGCRTMGTGNGKFNSLVATDLIMNNINGATTSNGTDSRFVMRITTIALPS